MSARRAVLRDAGKLVAGSVLAQLVSSATMLVIARIYSPDAYGQYSIVMSVLAMLAPAATLTLHFAVVLPARPSTARRLVDLAIVTAAAIGAFSFAVLIAVSPDFGERIGLAAGQAWLVWFVPVLLLLNGVCDPHSQWLIRTEQFGALARNGVYTVLVQRGLQLLAGLGLASALSLLVAQVATMAWRAAHLVMLCRPTLAAARAEGPPPPIRSLWTAYSGFPLYRFPQALLHAVSMNMTVFALGYFFGAPEAAYFAMARALLLLPVGVVSQAVGSAVLPRLLRRLRAGRDVSRGLLLALAALAAVGVVPFLALGLFAQEILSVLLGAAWSEAGVYAELLAVMMFMQFVQEPLTRMVPALHLQRFALVAEIGTLLLRLAAILIGSLVYQSVVVAIAAYAIVSALASLLIVLAVILRSRRTTALDLGQLQM